MNPIQDMDFQNVLSPQAIVNNASFTCNVVDTQGYDYVTFIFQLGALDIALSALHLTESDAEASSTSLTSGTTIATSDFSTSPATLPSATDDNHLFGVFVNMHGRKRYILPVITMGNGSTGGFVSCIAILSKGKIAASTAALRGFTQNLFT
jgi:hypothetical protein